MSEHLGVQYRYADISEDRADKVPTPCVLDPASLQIMPSDWLADLRQAAFAVDGDRILQLIEQIPVEGQRLAEQLTELLRQFCFDEILELIPENTEGAA